MITIKKRSMPNGIIRGRMYDGNKLVALVMKVDKSIKIHYLDK